MAGLSRRSGNRRDLAITDLSVPDGRFWVRRESPTPYWIADCHDEKATADYTFGPRHGEYKVYLHHLRESLEAIRALMKPGALIVQMVAFSKDQQLNGYLDVMKECGIREMRMKPNQKIIWRDVPNRK